MANVVSMANAMNMVNMGNAMNAEHGERSEHGERRFKLWCIGQTLYEAQLEHCPIQLREYCRPAADRITAT